MSKIQYAIGKEVEDFVVDPTVRRDMVPDENNQVYYKILSVSADIVEIRKHLSKLRQQIDALLLLKVAETRDHKGSKYTVVGIEQE